jgi:holliday junction DNA helicase RuvB
VLTKSKNSLGLVASSSDGYEPAKLRPTSFDEYTGQDALIQKLRVYVTAAKNRQDPLDHVLLHGPPGLGKTTLAQIVANEMGAPLKISSGPTIEHRGILMGLLTDLQPNEILFIDEIHRLSPAVEEILYTAMEDGYIDVPVDDKRTVPLQLPPFTLIGATTRTDMLTAPLRDRFPIIERLSLYAAEDLARIVTRTASILGFEIEAEAAYEIGRRSRGTPRIANRLTRRLRDFLEVGGSETLDVSDASEYLTILEVDSEGLTPADRHLLQTILETFSGGPVGIEALSSSTGIPKDTIIEVHEPFLLQNGFMLRSPRGRKISAKAYTHLGFPCP